MSLLVNFQTSYAGRLSRPVDPWAPVKFLIKITAILMSIILFLAVVGILIFLAQGITNAQQSGALQVVFTQADIFFSNIPLTNIIYQFGKDVVRVQQNPETVITQPGWRSTIDKNAENKDLGLVFTKKVEPEILTYFVDEDIKLTSEARILSHEETYVGFNCSITNGYPDGKTFLITRPDQPRIEIRKEIRETIPITCEISKEPSFVLDSGLDVQAKKVRLEAIYGFKTESYIPIYTMQNNYLIALQDDGKDPFEGISEPLLDKSSGKTRSISENAPMELIINLGYTQPLTDDVKFSSNDIYEANLVLKSRSSEFLGRLRKINDAFFYIHQDAGFQLVDEEGLFEEVEVTDEDDAEGFLKYKLNEEKINELNMACDKFSGGIYSGDCEYTYQRGVVMTDLKFKIVNLEASTLTPSAIRARIDYEYQSEAFGSFNIKDRST